MKATFVILFSILAFGFAGCASTSMYSWGKYENTLYKYYKNPDEVEKYAESLSEIIQKGEVDGRVPPGIYAEYGYVLLITDDNEGAVAYFEKEKARWPESTMLMDKMIVSAMDGKKNTANRDNNSIVEAKGATIDD